MKKTEDLNRLRANSINSDLKSFDACSDEAFWDAEASPAMSPASDSPVPYNTNTSESNSSLNVTQTEYNMEEHINPDQVDIINVPLTAKVSDLEPLLDRFIAGGHLAWRDYNRVERTKTARIHFDSSHAASHAVEIGCISILGSTLTLQPVYEAEKKLRTSVKTGVRFEASEESKRISVRRSKGSSVRSLDPLVLRDETLNDEEVALPKHGKLDNLELKLLGQHFVYGQILPQSIWMKLCKENLSAVSGLLLMVTFFVLTGLKIDNVLDFSWHYVFLSFWLSLVVLSVVPASLLLCPSKRSLRRWQTIWGLLSIFPFVVGIVVFGVFFELQLTQMIRWRWVFVFLPLLVLVIPVALTSILCILTMTFTEGGMLSFIMGVAGLAGSSSLIMVVLKLEGVLHFVYSWALIFLPPLASAMVSITSGAFYIFTRTYDRQYVDRGAVVSLTIFPSLCVLLFLVLLSLRLDHLVPNLLYTEIFIPFYLMALVYLVNFAVNLAKGRTSLV